MKAEKYVGIIMRDDTDEIVSETPTIYKSDLIERIYEFTDGAVVKYEWQDMALKQFNHRFHPCPPPAPNPEKLATGSSKLSPNEYPRYARQVLEFV